MRHYNHRHGTSSFSHRWLLIVACARPRRARCTAQGFKFSNEDQADKAAEAERQAKVQAQLATPCRDKIKNQKIMVLIGEDRNGAIFGEPVFVQLRTSTRSTSACESLGLRTYSPEEIRRQVAQAEIDAYFRNDPDAAISASKRLAAQYILRGLIATQSGRNAIVNVNQVSVSMDFTLTGANGRMISQAGAKNESYAGRDTSRHGAHADQRARRRGRRAALQRLLPEGRACR